MIKYFGVLTLLLFFVLLGTRALTLRRRGIKAIVFGKTDKSDFVLVPILLAFVYAFLADAFALPIPQVLIRPFWVIPAVRVAGLALCAMALIAFAATLKSFGDSFRVGIDEKNPDKLVTTGMFAISRNPIYVSFLAFFLGLFLQQPNIAQLCALVLFALAIHRQILREESFLKGHYGQDYAQYCGRVRRYL